MIFGPNFKKFKEAKDLIARGGAFTVKNKREFVSIVSRLLTDSEYLKTSGTIAGDYIKNNAGASELILRDLYQIPYKK